jgi:hypothetical protein
VRCIKRNPSFYGQLTQWITSLDNPNIANILTLRWFQHEIFDSLESTQAIEDRKFLSMILNLTHKRLNEPINDIFLFDSQCVSSISPQAFELLVQKQQLRYLILRGPSTDPKMFENWDRLVPHLGALRLFIVHQSSDITLSLLEKVLQHAKNIQYLILSNCTKIESNDIEKLKQTKGNVSNCHLSSPNDEFFFQSN